MDRAQNRPMVWSVMLRRTLVLGIAWLALGGVARAAPDPQVLLAKVQKFYDATRDLHAHFEQTLTSAIGSPKKASGEVWLKKPGRMRWDYSKPEKKLMVADGQILWVYEPEDAQAFKQDLRSSS